MGKIHLRDNQFAIQVGNKIEWVQDFTEANFLRATKIVLQRHNGIPDDRIIDRWVKSFKEPVE